MSKFMQMCNMLGVHPLAGLGVFAVDWMLFGGEGMTLGASWLVSIGVAAVLTIATILIQKSLFRDQWLAAIGKGLIIGLLTAIPTALPSVVPLVGGVMGTWSMLSGNKALTEGSDS